MRNAMYGIFGTACLGVAMVVGLLYSAEAAIPYLLGATVYSLFQIIALLEDRK